MTTIDPDRSAVLAMDFQMGILARLGDAAAPLVDRAASVVRAARGAGLPVLHVVLGFRPGYPEVSARNPVFAPIVRSGLFVTDAPGRDLHPSLTPEAADLVVVKHRVGAFAGTDLDMILRARSIDTLVLLGVSTSGVVLSTVRHAADADYRMLVVSDGCGDPDAEVHRVLMAKVLVRQATVLPGSDVIEALRSPG